MNQFFGIPEIVTIVANAGLSDDDRSVHRGVLSLMQTCHTLYEPIANVVWYSIPTLKPLIACISQEIWNHALGNFNDDSGVRSARPGDLSRLRLNSKRVRVYGVDFDPQDVEDDKDLDLPEEATATVFSILSLLSGGSTLLPNLCEANLNQLKAEILPFVHLITPPELRTLKIAVVFGKIPQKEIFGHLSFLNSLGVRYPLLRNLHLKVKNERFAGVTPFALVEVLQSAQWHNLSSLQIDGKPVPYNAILPFLHSKTLRNIHVRFSESEEIPQEFNLAKNSTSSSIFPSIERLSLEFQQLSQITKFLTFLAPQTSSVREIYLAACKGTQSSSAVWRYLCECISTTFIMTDDLKELFLYDAVDQELAFSLSVREINPLRIFSGLQRIGIHSRGILDLDDDDVRNLAMAWPDIRELRLLGGLNNQPPKVTIEVLNVFAELCPKLVLLGIEFNALTSRVSSLGPRLPHRSYRLKTLQIFASPIGSPEAVALYISDVFPNIGLVVSFWENGGPVSSPNLDQKAIEAWNQVDKLVRIIGQARYDELRRIHGDSVAKGFKWL